MVEISQGARRGSFLAERPQRWSSSTNQNLPWFDNVTMIGEKSLIFSTLPFALSLSRDE